VCEALPWRLFELASLRVMARDPRCRLVDGLLAGSCKRRPAHAGRPVDQSPPLQNLGLQRYKFSASSAGISRRSRDYLGAEGQLRCSGLARADRRDHGHGPERMSPGAAPRNPSLRLVPAREDLTTPVTVVPDRWHDYTERVHEWPAACPAPVSLTSLLCAVVPHMNRHRINARWPILSNWLLPAAGLADRRAPKLLMAAPARGAVRFRDVPIPLAADTADNRRRHTSTEMPLSRGCDVAGRVRTQQTGTMLPWEALQTCLTFGTPTRVIGSRSMRLGMTRETRFKNTGFLPRRRVHVSSALTMEAASHCSSAASRSSRRTVRRLPVLDVSQRSGRSRCQPSQPVIPGPSAQAAGGVKRSPSGSSAVSCDAFLLTLTNADATTGDSNPSPLWG
jgi:hypothetical protein